MIVFGKNNVKIEFGEFMAEVNINGHKFKTTYDKNIKYINIVDKINHLVENEMKKQRKSLSKLFAFGESFRQDLINVLKGRA